MSKLIIRNIDVFFSKKIILLIMVFSYINIENLSIAKNIGLNYWEFILNTIYNWYYIVFFMIVFFVFSILNMTKSIDSYTLIRVEKYIKFFLSQIISLLIISFLFVMIHVLISIIMGYGLKITNNFSTDLHDQFSYTNISVLSKFFDSPVKLLIISIFYLTFGLFFIASIVLFMEQWLNKTILIISLVTAHILMNGAMKFGFDKFFPPIFINNYLIFQSALYHFEEKAYIFSLIELGFVGIVILLIKFFWHKIPCKY